MVSINYPHYKSRVINCILLVSFFIGFSPIIAQDADSTSTELPKTDFYDYRGTNTVDVSVGTSIMNGDYPDPIFGIYTHFGYKRYIIPYVNVNIGYHKFNLAYKDLFNNGFMSFDLNVEALAYPHKRLSPFIYAGGGIHASNYFKHVASKAQVGLGLEYIVYEGLGLKLYGDYNQVFSDEVDGKIYGDADDVYWRIAVGLNFYFGGQKKKKKLLENTETVFKSNPITPNK